MRSECRFYNPTHLTGPHFAHPYEPVTPDMVRDTRPSPYEVTEYHETIRHAESLAVSLRTELAVAKQKVWKAEVAIGTLRGKLRDSALRMTEIQDERGREAQRIVDLQCRVDELVREASRPGSLLAFEKPVNELHALRELYDQQHQVMVDLQDRWATERVVLEHNAKDFERRVSRSSRYLVDALRLLIDAGLVVEPPVWTLEETGDAIKKGIAAAVARGQKADGA